MGVKGTSLEDADKKLNELETAMREKLQILNYYGIIPIYLYILYYSIRRMIMCDILLFVCELVMITCFLATLILIPLLLYFLIKLVRINIKK